MKNSWRITLNALADFYNVSVPTIKKRINLPDCPPEVKLSRGQYNLKVFNEFVVQHFYGSEDVSRQMAEEKLRYQKYRSDSMEYEAKKLSGELLPIIEEQEGLAFVITGIKRKFLGWEKRLPPMLKGRNVKEMGAIIKKEIRILLNDLSQGISSIMPERQKRKPKKS